MLLPLIACVTWGVAIKRIIDYSRYKNAHRPDREKKESGDIDYSMEDYLLMQRRQELEQRKNSRPIIVIKDSRVYLVEGESDGL
jgi:hypothetical protein